VIQLAKYAYANAKIRAMLSRLLEPQFFDSLLSAKSFAESVDLLQKTPYGSVTAKADREAPDIHLLEEGFSLFDETVFRKVGLILSPAEQEFVLLLLEKFEIEPLKVALRIWYRKLRVDPGRFFPQHTVLHPVDYAKVINAQSIEELIVLLAETPYFRALARARDQFKQKDSLFYLEASLDLDYYERVLASIARFSPGDRATARRIIGIEIDIENINWLIRLKKYYNLALEDILASVIPGGERVTPDTVRRSYSTDGLGGILESVAIGPYTQIREMSEQNIYLIEGFLYEFLLREVKRALAGFPFSIGTVLGYLILKRRETRNIISILNAKQLGWQKDAVSSLISV
jgi:V/A-type H+/Na+-transporting ATPase subunit C